MKKLIKYLITAFLMFESLCSWSIQIPLAENSEFHKDVQEAFDQDQYEDYINFKNVQNSLTDKKRSKSLPVNEYWLINKEQDFWVGFFDGKYIKVPKGVYPDFPGEGYHPQQIFRIKNGVKTSQFLLSAANKGYPARCMNRNSAIFEDTSDYTYLYSGCTSYYINPITKKHIGYYDVLFYSKKFDTLLKLESFPYETIADIMTLSKSIKQKKDYYEYVGVGGAFKITAKDKVISIDLNTGKPINKIKETDPQSGKIIMVDDPEGFYPILLKRIS